MKILYIGNKLSSHGLNKTTVETLGENLAKEGFEVVSVSGRKSFFFETFRNDLGYLNSKKHFIFTY